MASTFDFAPLFRTAVGFDRMTRALEAASRLDESALSFPPYDIEKLDDDHYRIEMAVAGFSEADLEIVLKDGALVITGSRDENKDGERIYLHRGIARRGFERRFQLAEHIKVTDANLANGLLTVELRREIPEALKPRTIKIGSAEPKKLKAA